MKIYLHFILSMLLTMGAFILNGQSYNVPNTGFNVISCGTNATLCDAGGCTSNYTANSTGYTVIRSTGNAQITISGTFTHETNYDYFVIYDGVGTTGTVILSSRGYYSGTLNPYTAAPGQSITVQFISDGSVQYAGFNFNISFSSGCAPVTTLPANGTLSIDCGTTGTLVDNGGMSGNYTANNNSIVEFENGAGAILNLYGNYNLAAGDTLFLYSGIGASRTIISTFTGNNRLNFNSGLGEQITMQFVSNATTHAQGIDMLYSYNGSCICPTTTYTGITEICAGDTANIILNTATANTYSISNIPYMPLSCGGISGPTGDDGVTSPITLPFTFNFFGQNFTQVGISTNGNIQLGAGPYNDAFTSIGPIPGTNVRNMIALNYSDWMVTASASSITYQTVGAAPNRIFQVCFNNLTPFGGGVGNLTGQILLYETSNIVEMHIAQNLMPAAYVNQTQGLQFSNGIGVGYPGRNFSSWTASNSSVRFDPNVYYSWTPTTGGINITNPINPTFTSNIPGNHTYSYMYDFGYCYGISDSVVFTVGNISATYNATNISCHGEATGSINLVSPSAGDYIWSNGATTSSLNNLTAGVYAVTVSSGSCAYLESFTITEPNALAVAITNIVEEGCNNASNASIEIIASEGTAPYTYVWSNATSAQNLSNITAGTYTVTVTDANSCTVTLSRQLLASGVTATLNSLIDSVCYEASTGSINIDILPSSASVLWSNGATSTQIDNLEAGLYTAIATYANSNGITCQDTLTANIIQPSSPLIATIDIINEIQCNTSNSGELQAIATGGYGNYTYNWSNTATTSNINNLTAANYTVSISDDFSCMATASQSLSEAGLTVTVDNFVEFVCYGANTGNVTLNVQPATATVSWSTGSNMLEVNNLAAGTYTATISNTSANGVLCQEIYPFNILQPNSPLTADITILNDIDCIIPNGELLANASGGFGTYSYSWSNGIATANNDNLVAGNYFVTVTDAYACTATATATINALSMPILDAYIGQSGTKIIEVDLQTLINLTARLSDSSLNNIWSFSWEALNHNYYPNNANTTECNIQIPTPGEYNYRILSQYGDCILSDSLKVLVRASEFAFPTAFTPNQDGENDFFRPVNFVSQFLKTFKVYNRWGQLVFESSTEAAWDGTFKGETQPRDVYMYVLEYQMPQHTSVQVNKGQFTLLR